MRLPANPLLTQADMPSPRHCHRTCTILLQWHACAGLHQLHCHEMFGIEVPALPAGSIYGIQAMQPEQPQGTALVQ